MILLDTHVWVWWVQDDERLPIRWRDELDRTTDSLGVSIFSCWEVAKLTRLGRVQLPAPLVNGYPLR
jgi:PIN domain nuclease of toxin-antitoxin system